MTDWCPWLIRRKGKTWLCKIENDVCSNHEHYLLCTRYALAMKIIADPLSQELIKKASIDSDSLRSNISEEKVMK